MTLTLRNVLVAALLCPFLFQLFSCASPSPGVSDPGCLQSALREVESTVNSSGRGGFERDSSKAVVSELDSLDEKSTSEAELTASFQTLVTQEFQELGTPERGLFILLKAIECYGVNGLLSEGEALRMFETVLVKYGSALGGGLAPQQVREIRESNYGPAIEEMLNNREFSLDA